MHECIYTVKSKKIEVIVQRKKVLFLFNCNRVLNSTSWKCLFLEHNYCLLCRIAIIVF